MNKSKRLLLPCLMLVSTSTAETLPLTLQGELGDGCAEFSSRSNADGGATCLLKNGIDSWKFALDEETHVKVALRYSNDGAPDTVNILIDNELRYTFQTRDTRLEGGAAGAGWNEFKVTSATSLGSLDAGEHEIRIESQTGDQYGWELDSILLAPGPIIAAGRIENEAFVLEIHAEDGIPVDIERSPALGSPFTPIGSVSPAGNVAVFRDENALKPAAFYRVAEQVELEPIYLEAEVCQTGGRIMARGNASQQKTVWLHTGENLLGEISVPGAGTFDVQVRFTNDGPADTIQVFVDGTSVGSFSAPNTRPPGGVPGSGWNSPAVGPKIGPVRLTAGNHAVELRATTDAFGWEADRLEFLPR